MEPAPTRRRSPKEAPRLPRPGSRRQFPRPRRAGRPRLDGVGAAAEGDGFDAVEDDEVDEAPVVFCRRIGRGRIEGRHRARPPREGEARPGDGRTEVALQQHPVAVRDLGPDAPAGERVEMGGGVDEAHNHVLAIAVDGDDAAIGRSTPDVNPVETNALRRQNVSDPLAGSIAAERSGETDLLSATGKHDRLVDPLAAEVLEGAPSRNGLPRAAETCHAAEYEVEGAVQGTCTVVEG